MSLKHQYILDIGLSQANNIPYSDNPKYRIRQIYRTARLGNLRAASLAEIWIILSPIFRRPNQIPSNLNDYNNFAKKKIKSIALAISHNHQLKFGISQKLFNLFIKDLWAWQQLTPHQEKVAHFPLDRNILNLLNDSPWKSWTKIVVHENDYAAEYEKYLCVQRILRDQLQYSIFRTPLELEQYLWHGFY